MVAVSATCSFGIGFSMYISSKAGGVAATTCCDKVDRDFDRSGQALKEI